MFANERSGLSLWRWSMLPRNLHDMLDFHTPGARRRRNPKARHLFTTCWRRQHTHQPARNRHDKLA